MGFRELRREHVSLAKGTQDAMSKVGEALNTLSRNQKITHNELVQFVRMGFVARLRWVLFGTVPATED